MDSAYCLGEKRVQKIGNSLMVSLPVSWARNMQTCKGDIVKMELLDDRSLRIIPNK